jgi:hypothetical protein
MRILAISLLCLCLLGGVAFAAAIDGVWVAERKMERDGQSFTISQTFDLKSDGNKLTGTISMVFGDREPRKMDIKDGKVDGSKFTFNTVMSTPNGEFKVVYEGTVEGNVLKCTSTREGGEPRSFEAKRK